MESFSKGGVARGAASLAGKSVLQAIAVWGLQLRGAEAAPERSYTRSKLERCAGWVVVTALVHAGFPLHTC